jgi:prolyl oligopeptidase
MRHGFPAALAAALAFGASPAAAQPATPKIPMTDTYHGVKVVDDYRWLENGDNPKVKAWSAAQNARSRSFLDQLPGRKALGARIEHLVTSRPASISGPVLRGGRTFAWCFDPAHKQQPWIVLLPSLASVEGMRAVVDPNALDASGHTAVDWFVPSPDGSRIAVSLSQGGSEEGTLHVVDVATGRETGDVIPRVQVGTAGGSVAWTADSKGLWYTRYPHDGERQKEDLDFYQQVWFHTLGAPAGEDRIAFGKDLPRIAEIFLRASGDGRRHLALVQNGDSGDFALFVHAEGTATWQAIGTFADGIMDARFGPDGSIWVISKKGAPHRRVLRIPAGDLTLAAARTVLDQRAGVFESIALGRSRLFTVEALGGKSRVRGYDFDGNLTEEPPTPAVSAIGELEPLDGDRVFYGVSSFLQPYTGYVYDAAMKTSTPTVVGRKSVADFSDAEVVEESALSKDGTRVPMFILQPKGIRRDGRNPVVLTGYGGYGISQTPEYSDLAHVFTERGVVQVSAILRGGGEFGQEWHDAGRLTKKQNVFEDFLACARRLIELGVTKPDRLAIEGGSNGGLLMGAALTQAPQLFRAVVSHVGIYDMLRVETSPNGQFNTVEFGTVKVPDQFKALYAYSPYHRVKNGTHYPAILMPTGANDPRVDPMQSRKMIARLQAADPKGTILLRTSGSTGHGGIGAGVADVISLALDVDAFLLSQLGVPLATRAR